LLSFEVAVTRRAIAIALGLCALLPATAAAEVPEGADWTEAYIETPGEPTLHADVLRPAGYKDTQKTPVILSIGPYFGHAGQSLPGETATSDENLPSSRFDDMIEGGKVFERGYTVVYVDARGFGGSAGCNDFGGPGEQLDAKRAIEWAAAQPWSTGKVGTWGKSYDGWTQVMALDERPKGLAAAVIQSPIIDGYRTLYQNGVHYDAGWYNTPALYQAIDANPPTPFDSPEYFAGAAQGTNPACYATNIAMQNATFDEDSQFWKDRELPDAKGSKVAVLWSHGFLDANTKPDNFMDVWSNLKGPARAWFGQYDHVRGNEANLTGRDGFLEESMRWFDRYLKDDKGAKVEDDPRTEIQDSDGRWRAEEQWPPADAAMRILPVKGGSVTDAPNNDAEGETTGATGVGVWSVSQPLDQEARIAGVPRIHVQASALGGRSHIYALLYDIDWEKRTATLMSRAAHVVTGADQKLDFELYPLDWHVTEGHRLGLLLSGADLDWYNPPHSGQPVTITDGTLEIPWLRYVRRDFLKGDVAKAMEGRTPITVDESIAESGAVTADFPPPLSNPPANGTPGSGPAATPRAARLRVSAKRKGRKLKVTVRGAGSFRITVKVRKGKRVVVKRAVRAKRGVARVSFRLNRGRYRIVATAKGVGAPKRGTKRVT
jgi:predicted acyl esterase